MIADPVYFSFQGAGRGGGFTGSPSYGGSRRY